MLSIRQMAGIFSVSKKTLLHYDSIGLFSPLKTGEENQYRYYGFEQLNELRRIIWLKTLGVGIDTILRMKINDVLQDEKAIELLLDEHAQSLSRHIEEKQKLLNNVERMKDHLLQTKEIEIEPKLVSKGAFTIWHRLPSEIRRVYLYRRV
jgi:DNA-binding transcriptional MerR regulator